MPPKPRASSRQLLAKAAAAAAAAVAVPHEERQVSDNRSIPADVKSALTIMCTTRISVW
jgi:hypothetical protein